MGFLGLLNEVHYLHCITFTCPASQKPSTNLATIGDIIHYLVKGISHHTNFPFTVRPNFFTQILPLQKLLELLTEASNIMTGGSSLNV